jgi:hypothetical protein
MRRRRVADLRAGFSIFGALVACSGDANSISGPQSPLYPNQPAGYTRIAETNDSILPFPAGGGGLLGTLSGVLAGTIADAGSSPSSLLTVVSGTNLPVAFSTQTSAQKFIFEAGTPAGYQEAGNDGAGYYLWDNMTLVGANGGPAANEYSAFYQSTWFSVYGNGTTIEVPGAEIIKLFYMGSTFNNLNTSGGFTQMYWGMQCVSAIATSPLTCSQFRLNLYNQNGDDQTFAQNLNTSKHIVVGQVHHLEMVLTTGTDQGANGTVDWWLDGVHIGTASNGKFLDHAITYAGASGTAGFTSFSFQPWWGGAGGPNKTRNDDLYFGHTYISGILVRSRQ